jgi:hypothetical protein
MKPYIYILLFSLFTGSNLYAQKNIVTIITDLETSKVGQGKVRIYEDEAISGLIGSKTLEDERVQFGITAPAKEQYVTTDSAPIQTNSSGSVVAYKEAIGYKIQVYSGNEQRNSKIEGESRRNLIHSAYPDMELNLIYITPVWRLMAGNFKSYEEAFQALTDMKKTFPNLGKEMQIKKAKIKLPIY